MKKYLPIMVVFALLLYTLSAGATSIWDDEAASLYEDRSDFERGDIITVVIEEDASAMQSADTDASQEIGVEGEAGAGFLDFLPFFGAGYSDQQSADGQTQRSGTLEANITTQVEEVLPNGNMRVTGRKNIKINDEEQVIKLSGIVRPDDIDLDNTIDSTRVAEAQIEYEGQGIIGDKQQQGLITRLFNWLF